MFFTLGTWSVELRLEDFRDVSPRDAERLQPAGPGLQTNLDANMGKLGRPEDTDSATLGDRDRWSVFVINKGQAHRRAIEIGHRNQSEPDRTRNMQTTRRFELLD
jgi:hypothetical protein